ncbi:MAG: dihydropteroate synthase, partial [Cyclobacteriaceae bacterium]
MSDSSSFFERLNNTSTPPMVMGILNVTPDSFYDGGKYVQKETILSQAQKMVNEGTDIIDVGGMSSRPGAKEISIEEEQDRVCAVITQIRKEFPLLEISIDTYRTKVAEEALNSGATIINDISGGDLCEDMFTLVAQKYVPYIMMHM